MDFNQTTSQSTSSGSVVPKSNNMLWAWIGLAVVFTGFSLAFYYFGYRPSGQGQQQEQSPSAEEDVILNELGAVNLDDLDLELADIDKELAQ